MAVKMEQNGFIFYNKALERNDLDATTKMVLTKLRDDEKEHEKTFLALRNKIDKLDIAESPSWEEAQPYIESVVESHVFSKPENAIHLAQRAENVVDLLNSAIQFEKDTILFFFALTKYLTGQKADKAIDVIINEEASHIKKLRELFKAF